MMLLCTTCPFLEPRLFFFSTWKAAVLRITKLFCRWKSCFATLLSETRSPSCTVKKMSSEIWRSSSSAISYSWETDKKFFCYFFHQILSSFQWFILSDCFLIRLFLMPAKACFKRILRRENRSWCFVLYNKSLIWRLEGHRRELSCHFGPGIWEFLFYWALSVFICIS